MRSLIDILDLSVEEIDALIADAENIIADPGRYADCCRGKQLAALFFEPSTRTRLSFESAMLALGGQVLSVTGAGMSSVSKGESIADTIKTVSCYADIIAMRHPQDGAALVAANSTQLPVINAGDGGHNHPTQTLADLLTIHREKGRLGHLAVGVCGDLKYGRTVHSLIAAMSRYPGIRFVLISPEALRVPDYVTDGMNRMGIPYTQTASLENALPDLDILYMTRIQRERFFDPALYEALKDSYILTADKMRLARPDMCVMHPLPRVNEISVAVDSDPRACYFKQMFNGKMMRMALIRKLLSDPATPAPRTDLYHHLRCMNPRCVCQTEQELQPAFFRVPGDKEIYRCLYCEMQAR